MIAFECQFEPQPSPLKNRFFTLKLKTGISLDELPKFGHRNINLWIAPSPILALQLLVIFFYIYGISSMIRVLSTIHMLKMV